MKEKKEEAYCNNDRAASEYMQEAQGGEADTMNVGNPAAFGVEQLTPGNMGGLVSEMTIDRSTPEIDVSKFLSGSRPAANTSS